MDLYNLTLSEMLGAISRGESTSAEILESCLAAIARLEPQVGAWQHLDSAKAVMGRWNAERTNHAKSVFKGLPLAVKDTFDVAGLPAERGSPIYRGRVAEEDAACVAQLRACGLFPLGKTVTTEFAYFTPGKTANPHHLQCTPGGSSSGSAAAVAAGMVPVALGSQTAASVIRPAAFCGVVGYVATRGRFPLRGILPLAQSCDSLGVMARSIEDVGLVCDALEGSRPAPAVEAVKPRRLLAMNGAAFGPVEPEMSAAFERNIASLRRSGVEIRDFPSGFGMDWVDRHKKVIAYEAALTFADEYSRHRELLSPEFRGLVEEGRQVPAVERDALLAACRHDLDVLAKLMEDRDAIIAPSAPGPAPRGLAATGNPFMSRPWQLLGLPQCTVPMAYTADARPLGLQLIGMFNRDRALFAWARWLQAELDWRVRSPQLAGSLR